LSDSAAGDESLLESAGEGDPKAFEQLLQRYQAWAWRRPARTGTSLIRSWRQTLMLQSRARRSATTGALGIGLTQQAYMDWMSAPHAGSASALRNGNRLRFTREPFARKRRNLFKFP